MSTTEFDDELEYLLSKDRKFPNAQKQPRYDNDLEEDDQVDQLNDDHSHDQTYDSDNNSTLTVKSDEIVDDQSIEALSEISEIETDIVSLLDNKDEISDNGNEEIVRSPRSHDRWDKMANNLSKMSKWEKGEALEIGIKDQLESYGFIVTKTQSKINNRIIGDNGTDLIFQKKINNQMIRGVVVRSGYMTDIRFS